MDTRTRFILLLVIIVAAVIVVTLVTEKLREKDLRDQVAGKKPERKIDKNRKENFDSDRSSKNIQIEIDREILKQKSGQNLLGPK